MKKLILSLVLSVLFLNITSAQRTGERTGFEGDYFSLEGAIEVFKQSRSIRDFERNLNTRDRYVNNLDLDHDGRTDYIRVEHKRRGNFHAIILQVPISRREVQDIAVIEIEKTRRRTAVLQIIGDEYLYGEEVIVEPIARGNDSYRDGFVNVYRWNVVQQILGRRYNPWISPYRWSYYPTWWSPWRQYGWNAYYPRTIIYHNHYGYVNVHRVYRVHDFYRPFRVYCPAVVQRSNRVHVINGTTRRPAAKVNRRVGKQTQVRRNTNQVDQRRVISSKRKDIVTKTEKRRSTTAPARQQSKTRVDTRNKVSTPTRQQSRTKVTRQPRTSTAPSRASTRANKTRSTTSRAKTSPTRTTRTRTNVQRSAPRATQQRRSSASKQRVTTPSRKRTTRSSASTTKRKTRKQ